MFHIPGFSDSFVTVIKTKTWFTFINTDYYFQTSLLFDDKLPNQILWPCKINEPTRSDNRYLSYKIMTLYRLALCRHVFILEGRKYEKFNCEVDCGISIHVLVVRVCRLIIKQDKQPRGNNEKWRTGQYGISK